MPTTTEDAQTDAVEQPDEDAGDRTILVYSAPLTRATNTANLLELAKEQHAFDPSIFDESPPFFWRTIPSNQNVDAYGTRMMPGALKQFAVDATDGVSFMASHDTNELALGRSVRGEYLDARRTGGPRMEGDFYTIPDLELNRVKTNQFIRGVRAGIVHDVSIGFYNAEIRCSVCDEPWWSFWGMTFNDCDHMPGMTYEKLDKNGEPTGERVVASGDVVTARLAEVSAVYDGATPGAAVVGILRAERMIDAGRINVETVRALEAHYRVKLPGNSHIYQGADAHKADAHKQRQGAATTTEEAVVPNEATTTTTEAGDGKGNEAATTPPAVTAEVEQGVIDAAAERGRKEGAQSVRVLLRDAGVIEKDDVRDFATISRELGAQIVEWRGLADDARSYRKSLLDEAMAEGVRALANDFSEESYRSLLANAPLDTIRRMRDDWKKVADDKLKGGRQTKDDGNSNGSIPEFKVPANVTRG